jgi:RND family efflux transporter MFP subunit
MRKTTYSILLPRTAAAMAVRIESRLAWVAIAATTLVGCGDNRKPVACHDVSVPDVTVTVTRANLPITVTERGELEGAGAIETRCELEGDQNKIATLLPEGSHVKKGDVVVTFDAEQLKRAHDDQEIKWKQAECKTIVTRAELETVRNKIQGDTAKAELACKLAQFDRDKYLEGDYRVEDAKKKGLIALEEEELQQAKDKLTKLRMLVKKGYSPPEILRVKELEIENKAYTLSSNKADLTLLEKFTRKKQEMELTGKIEDAKRELARVRASGKSTIEKAQTDLEAAETAVRLEKAALSRARNQLERAIVKAPQDGILVYTKDHWWNPENRLQPGAKVRYHQTLFSQPDLSRMQVRVRVHEARVERLRPGLSAEIRMESLANTLLHGSVTKVETLAELSSYVDEHAVKEYATIVKLDDLPGQRSLKPGMTAEVRILTQELSNVPVVPVQAVVRKAKNHFAYVVSPNGFERREVTVGENNDRFVEIKRGLEDGETVALDARSCLEAESEQSKDEEVGKTRREKPIQVLAVTHPMGGS